MSGFYDEMREVADELLGEFSQGTVTLRHTPMTPAVNPWDAPTPGTPVDYALDAVVKRLHHRYENGALIIEDGDMVTFAVPAITPALTDTLIIDGVQRVISNITPVPGAGTVLAYKAWCAV